MGYTNAAGGTAIAQCVAARIQVVNPVAAAALKAAGISILGIITAFITNSGKGPWAKRWGYRSIVFSELMLMWDMYSFMKDVVDADDWCKDQKCTTLVPMVPVPVQRSICNPNSPWL
jgi:hypothetical protein